MTQQNFIIQNFKMNIKDLIQNKLQEIIQTNYQLDDQNDPKWNVFFEMLNSEYFNKEKNEE